VLTVAVDTLQIATSIDWQIAGDEVAGLVTISRWSAIRPNCRTCALTMQSGATGDTGLAP
jgi:hypothetical protein